VKKTSVALLAVPLAASMLLAGCGGNDKPQTSSSNTAGSSSSSTATPTPSASSTTIRATDPDIPPAARAHTPAGAEAFTRYFIERSNVAWTGPHAGILTPLCQASAIACAALEKDATRLAKAGHRYDGNPVTIKFIGVLDASKTNKYDVLANVVQENRNEIDATGKVYVTDKRKNLRLNFELLYTGGEWSVANMKVVK
jgi:hypothetical protein